MLSFMLWSFKDCVNTLQESKPWRWPWCVCQNGWTRCYDSSYYFCATGTVCAIYADNNNDICVKAQPSNFVF